jgi:GT2 family glycosyltransferase
MKIKIAVCIPAFSNAENINNCIDSLIKSNNNFYDLSILLYNNSGTQDIVNICKEYAFEYNFIHLFDYRINRGCSITWNDAIEYVYFLKPNYYSSLIFVNDDIEFLENSFVDFVQASLENPDIPVITSGDISADGYSVFSYSRFAYEKIGFFDENIRPAYFEDADFATRIEKLNLNYKEHKININHIGSASGSNSEAKHELESIHLPRTKGYYHKKWNNPVIFNGFPTRYPWPFDRLEEKYRISYWERKRPHPTFTNIIEMPFAFERFELIKNSASDINEHIETIFNITKGCKTAVSLQIGKGDAAFSLLLGCQLHISVDPNPAQDTINFLNEYFGKKSIVIRQNTCESIDVENFDVLMVDSHHTASNVEKELKAHAHKVNKFIIFHDTFLYGEIGDDGGEGIKKPIYEFLSNNQEWKIIHEVNNNNGLIILAK